MKGKEPESRKTEGINYKKVQVGFQVGDITQVQSDALITLINSGGMWFGGIDGAIMRTAGSGFHQTASEYLEAHSSTADGQAIFANGSKAEGSKNFKNVIFVIDDLHLPLQKLVEAGLTEAYKRNLKTVTMPLMRSGVMAGVVEKTPEQVASGMMLGIKDAADKNPTSSLTAKIIVYSDASGSGRKILQASAEKVLGAV